MKLYLIRHGDAAWTTPDHARALTEKGQHNSEMLFERHKADWQTLGEIWVSPFQRAQESYQLLRPFAPPKVEIIISDVLTPDISPNDVIARLSQDDWSDSAALVLVGHNPLLSNLLNKLTGQPKGFYNLGTSGIAALELSVIAAGCAQLLWIEAGY